MPTQLPICEHIYFNIKHIDYLPTGASLGASWCGFHGTCCLVVNMQNGITDYVCLRDGSPSEVPEFEDRCQGELQYPPHLRTAVPPPVPDRAAETVGEIQMTYLARSRLIRYRWSRQLRRRFHAGESSSSSQVAPVAPTTNRPVGESTQTQPDQSESEGETPARSSQAPPLLPIAIVVDSDSD